jgi:hypothetical protein
MSTLPEIEAAIEKLPEPQVEELSRWLEERRTSRINSPHIDAWLQAASGAAVRGITTDAIMNATRGEE